ncbi:hypothetical protein KP509_1Z152700 [Ceratopteris richardii]|nr:hypothetical protein KP509_1Z153300 [Ceratopteris richardii]KAH6556828.1 hypothetical protein KP509_1Z152700 [Ceratopteris richardii]
MGLRGLLVLLIIMLMLTNTGSLHALRTLGARHGSHSRGHHTSLVNGSFAVFIKDYSAPRANEPKSNMKLPNGRG